MKKRNNWLLVIIVCIVVVMTGQYLKHDYETKVLVKQVTLDSLHAYIKIADSLIILANLPPDTIYVHDTTYVDTSRTIITNPASHQNPIDTSITTYTDTLKVEKEIDVSIIFNVNGRLISPIKWEYKPVIRTIESIIEKKVPYPVIETIEIKKPITGHYLSLNAEGNNKMLIFGVGYDMVKDDRIYGIEYKRFGNQGVYGVKIGININTLLKNIRNGP